jgi:hypothetical protein
LEAIVNISIHKWFFLFFFCFGVDGVDAIFVEETRLRICYIFLLLLQGETNSELFIPVSKTFLVLLSTHARHENLLIRHLKAILYVF